MKYFTLVLIFAALVVMCSNNDKVVFPTTLANLEVSGMHCDDCAKNVKKALADLHGVESAEVSFDSGKATVKFDKNIISISEILETAGTAGTSVKQYQVTLKSEENLTKDKNQY